MNNSIYLCQSIIKISYQNMKQVRFEFEELPYDTLLQFGLTQEMIEDLPMQTLEAISHGRHSPVLPIKVNDENGNTVTERSRFAFVRKENGEADVIFFPVLKKSPLEKYNEEQKKQLQSGKTILADSVTAEDQGIRADRHRDQPGHVRSHTGHRPQPPGIGRGTETQQCRNQSDAARGTFDLRDGRRTGYGRH